MDSTTIALNLCDIIELVEKLQRAEMPNDVGLVTIKDELWTLTRRVIKEGVVDATV